MPFFEIVAAVLVVNLAVLFFALFFLHVIGGHVQQRQLIQSVRVLGRVGILGIDGHPIVLTARKSNQQAKRQRTKQGASHWGWERCQTHAEPECLYHLQTETEPIIVCSIILTRF